MTVFATSVVALVLFTPGALAVAGAAFTTANYPVDGDHCQNGQNNSAVVNCNIYDGKQFVWINGGPNSVGPSSLTDGDYFFAVLVPGGQPDPNDGGAKNLSDESTAGGFDDTCGDAYGNRTFTVSGGDISSYTGDGADYYTTPNGSDGSDCAGDTVADPHDQSGSTTHGQLIRLFPYDTTNNNGGVYILAVCRLGPTGGPYTYPVDPRDCKYDAFKVKPTGGEVPPASELAITKTASGSFDKKYTWQIDKDVDKTSVTTSAATATFNYTVKVTHDGGTNGNWKVTGTITVDNFNDFAVSGVDITDAINDLNASCTVTGGTGLTIPALSGGVPGEVTVGYTCDYGGATPASNTETNTATVSWPATDGNDPNSTDDDLAAGSADFSLPFSFPANPANVIDDCITVVDDNFTPLNTADDTTLGTVCVSDNVNPKTYNFSRTVNVPRNTCTSYTNTAAFTTDDTKATGSDDVTVSVCGPVTGGLTIGFWQNKNGQAIITGGASTGGICNSGTYLRTLAPFQDLSAAANCTGVALYVYNIVKAATAKGAAMNAMLKAQMLATALDVFFAKVAGGTYVDLTKICKMIDGSGGTATCSGVYRNVSAAFGGATCLTVNQILAYAASQSNGGGTSWYGQSKATQELAKDTFDAINNQVAFSCTP